VIPTRHYELSPQFQYQFSDYFAARIGYRSLNYKTEDGSREFDGDISGLMLGVGWTFPKHEPPAPPPPPAKPAPAPVAAKRRQILTATASSMRTTAAPTRRVATESGRGLLVRRQLYSSSSRSILQSSPILTSRR
jgi:hypothetical protein